MKNHSLYEVILDSERIFRVSVTKANDKLLCRIIKFGYDNIQQKNSSQFNIPILGHDFEIENILRTSKEIEDEIILEIKENVITNVNLDELSLKEIDI